MDKMNEEQKLYNEDILQALKDVLKAIKRQETKVNVAAPNISVEPTPITVESKEVSLDTSDLKNALEGVTERLNEQLEVKVANPQAQIDKIEVKNLKQIEALLKDLIAKDTVIKVNTEAPIVNVASNFGVNPKEYIPVRLTDGEQFYNAVAALTRAGGIDKRFEFQNGNLNVNINAGFNPDSDITTEINGSIITQTDGIKTLTITINGNTITEVWS
jgi:6-pyruvoyl-tetrahydropterin synthase